MERPDAIRARDDVLNRLGGHVSTLSETAPVRIGFGKIDAVPTAPMATAPPSSLPGLTYASGPPTAVTVPPPSATTIMTPDIGGDSSSSPTRALWIGSIPGTTGSATLLQIFSPFGPVESARVLSAKVS
jgi:protein JSN1